jgi:hypothetical protein
MQHRPVWHGDCHQKVTASLNREVPDEVNKFYYIALKGEATCEGIIRSKSIDSARRELKQQGMEEINLALLRSDTTEFLDLENSAEGSAGC